MVLKKLPEKCENCGYFLKEEEGGKKVVGGTVLRTLCMREETSNEFSIHDILGHPNIQNIQNIIKPSSQTHSFYLFSRGLSD